MKTLYTLLFISLSQLLLAQNMVTFSVDMSTYTGTYTNVNLNGGFNGWCGECAVMLDENADGVYELVVDLPSGTQEYKFTVDGWTDDEIFEPGEECTLTTDVFTNRVIEVTGDLVLPTVCWESCSACGVTGLSELTNESYSLFPNPSNGLVQLSSDALYDVQTVRVYSHTGQLVKTIAFNEMQTSMLDLQDLPSGVYHIEVQSTTGLGVENIVIMD